MAKKESTSRDQSVRSGALPMRDPDELSEQALELVTGGVGAELASQNFAAFVQLTGSASGSGGG